MFTLQGLPLGVDSFSALTYATPCSSVGASTLATWTSDSVLATISVKAIAEVALILRRVGGGAQVSVDFQEDADDIDAGSPPNGELTLVEGASIAVGPFPNSGSANITTGDFNGDGFPDIALAESYETGGVLLNDQQFGFAPEQTFSESWWNVQTRLGATSVTLADLDGDGDLDYVFALYGQSYSERMIQLYAGDGRGNHALPTTPPRGLVYGLRGTNPMGTRVADFDHNGLLDIASGSNNVAHTADIILQTGPWEFTPTYAYNDHGYSNPQWIDVGDFNNDGWMDLVVPFLYGPVEVYLNSADGSGSMVFSGGYLSASHHQVAIADFNGDGYQDIAAHSSTESEVDVLYNDQKGGFSSSAIFGVSSRAGFLQAGDMDGDGDMDLVVCSNIASSVDVLLNDGQGAFATARVFPLDEPPFTLALDDFDRDGDLDVAVYTVTTTARSHLRVLWNL